MAPTNEIMKMIRCKKKVATGYPRTASFAGCLCVLYRWSTTCYSKPSNGIALRRPTSGAGLIDYA